MTFLIAIRNLIQHRKRTLILGGVLGGVTMLLVILLALGTGVRASLIESATTLSTGHLNVAGFYKVTAGQSAPIVTDYETILEVVQKSVPDLDYTTTRMRGWARVVSESGSAQWGIAGIDIQKEPKLRTILHLQQGKLDDLSQPNTALIFESQNEKLKVKVGDTVTISAPTPKGVNNTVDVRIVAIADDVGLLSKFNFFVPSQTLRNLYQIKPNTTGAIHVYLNHMSSIPEAQAALRKALEQAGYTLMEPDSKAFWQKFEGVNREDWTGQKLDVTTWEDEVSFLTWILTAINGIVGVLGFVLLIVISIGVMNAMWIAIRERTREIGTLRAIGMQRTRVLTMFLTEGFTLAIVATAAGTALGVLVSALINVIHVPLPGLLSTFLMSPTLKMAFDPAKIIGALVIITAATTLISLIPSFLAARLKPITAMHHIG
jgi:putative ABC transport system permease protein